MSDQLTADQLTADQLAEIRERDAEYAPGHRLLDGSVPHDRRVLLAEVERLQVRLAAVHELHSRGSDGWCVCGFEYPCQTRRLLELA